MSSQSLTSLSTLAFARFFVTLFQLQSSKKTVILDFLFQYFHGLFDIIADDPDCQVVKILQTPRPLLVQSGPLAVTPANSPYCYFNQKPIRRLFPSFSLVLRQADKPGTGIRREKIPIFKIIIGPSECQMTWRGLFPLLSIYASLQVLFFRPPLKSVDQPMPVCLVYPLFLESKPCLTSHGFLQTGPDMGTGKTILTNPAKSVLINREYDIKIPET